MSDVENNRKKARDLISRALHKETPPKEAVICAMNAVKIIEKYDLLSAPTYSGGFPDMFKIVDALGDEDVADAVRTVVGAVNAARKVSKKYRRGR